MPTILLTAKAAKLLRRAKRKRRLLRDFDFQIDVLLARGGRDSRQPILVREVFRPRPVSRWKDPPVPANSRPVIFPRMVHGAMRTLELFLMRLYLPESLRVITYSLHLFAEPDRSRDSTAILAEGGERYVFLSVDVRRDRHCNIVRRWRLKCVARTCPSTSLRIGPPHTNIHKRLAALVRFRLRGLPVICSCVTNQRCASGCAIVSSDPKRTRKLVRASLHRPLFNPPITMPRRPLRQRLQQD